MPPLTSRNWCGGPDMTPEQAQSLFPDDTEFLRLLQRSSAVDPVRAALEVARDHLPQLEFSPVFRWVEARAAELVSTALCADEKSLLRELAASLADGHGLGGDAECYHSPESSFLNCVIQTGRGIPLTLSLLYVAVGQRSGLDISGVGSPGHFLAMCQTAEGPLFVDAFAGGRILSPSGALSWLKRHTGWSGEQLRGTLRPATPRQIIIRLLNNLKRLYVLQERWSSALKVQQRLAALHPGHYEQKRDWAVLSLKAHRPDVALSQLAECLKNCPAEERASLQSLRQQAQAELAGWN